MTTLALHDLPTSSELTQPPMRRSRARTFALWAVQIAAAALFLAAGVSKLTSAAAMVQMFDAIGLGQWFRYVTGAIEVVGALMLLVPSMAFFGAVALSATMIGAICTHLFVIGGNPSLPIVLLTSTLYVAWTRSAGRLAPRAKR